MLILKLTLIFFTLAFLQSYASEKKSVCYGTTSKGSLKNAVKLPESGSNFESYSIIAGLLGRTYLHSELRDILLKTYRALEKKYPEKVFKYAETGLEEGGRFWPHKTHQNGLSLDHMVPVLKNGKSVHLPTNVWNKWGYNIEFDLKGNFRDYKLDYEALGALIIELDKQAKKMNRKIWRVLFDPKMKPDLLKTSHGQYLKKYIKFSQRRSWVRHDEHIHIDFVVPCS